MEWKVSLYSSNKYFMLVHLLQDLHLPKIKKK